MFKNTYLHHESSNNHKASSQVACIFLSLVLALGCSCFGSVNYADAEPASETEQASEVAQTASTADTSSDLSAQTVIDAAGDSSASAEQKTSAEDASSELSARAIGAADTTSVSGVWKKSKGKWWFQYSAETKANQNKSWPANEWVTIKGKRYHFDSKGYMSTNWFKSGKTWYYLGSDGAMKTGWKKVKGVWYYLNSSGKMLTGFHTINGKTYYLASSGAMKTGWQKISGKWYYFNGSGAMAQGWKKVKSTWYYLLPTNGVMQTGWQKIGDKWYYLNKSGAMQAKKWIGNYYVGASGAMATSTYVGKYYVDGNGKWVKPAGTIKALQLTKSYVDNDTTYGYSKADLTSSLKKEGRTDAEIKYALNNSNIDWNNQALKRAQTLIEGYTDGLSKTELEGKLKDLGFGSDEIAYAVDHCNADWNQQALKRAKSLLGGYKDGLSRPELRAELTSNKLGFTESEADFALSKITEDTWYEQARKRAWSYYDNDKTFGLSKNEMIKNLCGNEGDSKFTLDEAKYAVQDQKFDWNDQAQKRANFCLNEGDGYSKTMLVIFLSSKDIGFTYKNGDENEDNPATQTGYAVKTATADKDEIFWKNQALKRAKYCLEDSGYGYSKKTLIDLLKCDEVGFTYASGDENKDDPATQTGYAVKEATAGKKESFWNEQALKRAKGLKNDNESISEKDLREQLLLDDFSKSEIDYAINNL